VRASKQAGNRQYDYLFRHSESLSGLRVNTIDIFPLQLSIRGKRLARRHNAIEPDAPRRRGVR
jgi:hypothetical protein